jgi:hypothetical protein
MGLEHFNALLRTHDLVQDVKWDAELRARFETHQAAVLDTYELTREERRAIEARDFKALYEMGVHPYLLGQLARLIYGTVEHAGSSVAATALVDSLHGKGPGPPPRAA